MDYYFKFHIFIRSSRVYRLKTELVSEMSQFEIFCFLLICSSPFFIDGKVSEFQTIYFAAVRCNLSEQFFYKNYSCFAKSYSRNFSTMNFIATSKMPLNNIIVRLFYKSMH